MQISQAAISTLYALLNEITRYSDEDGATVDRYSMLTKNAISGAPDANQLSEKQKQQVCANALSAIVGVAVYLKDEAVSIFAILCMDMFLISLPPKRLWPRHFRCLPCVANHFLFRPLPRSHHVWWILHLSAPLAYSRISSTCSLH